MPATRRRSTLRPLARPAAALTTRRPWLRRCRRWRMPPRASALTATTLTFDSSFVGSTLAFTVTAENDDAIEGIEFDRVDAEQPDHRRGLGIDHGSVGERRPSPRSTRRLASRSVRSPASISEEAEAVGNLHDQPDRVPAQCRQHGDGRLCRLGHGTAAARLHAGAAGGAAGGGGCDRGRSAGRLQR